MESYKIENLNFAYPGREENTLSDINITVNQGEFITLCGKSGCGKTTLLRLLKSSLAPCGRLSGSICFNGKPLSDADARQQASEIGFVQQNPDNQIVTDKVWHELAFGLESLGYSTPEIRARVAEMASFFGIQTWFHKKITELSGGQKQLLSLASVMVMQPSVLILDEPTSQLDPIAAQEFLKSLEKINRELGTTVILTEHRLEDAFPISDRVVVVDSGRIIADCPPAETGKILKNHDMYYALPAPMRIFGALAPDEKSPLTVREGRNAIEEYAGSHRLYPELIEKREERKYTEKPVIEVKDVWFRYEKNLPDVVKGLSLSVYPGELYAIVGGNGTGKTTALSLISGLNKPYRGEVLVMGHRLSEIDNLYGGVLGVLPQNPQTLFVKKTVFFDLMEALSYKKLSVSEKEIAVKSMAALCRIDGFLDSHPYDLSGGEQQRAALAKVLLHEPGILLLDEPTKGMDAYFKMIFADILYELRAKGITVVMVSHDIEFCAEYADRCALVFDGGITSEGVPEEVFAGKSFYTTSANRMARTTIPAAVLSDDVIAACTGRVQKRRRESSLNIDFFDNKLKTDNIKQSNNKEKKLTPKRIAAGCVFALMFAFTCIIQLGGYIQAPELNYGIQLMSVAELALCLFCFFPQRQSCIEVQQPETRRKLTKRTAAAALLILFAIPLTVFAGVYYLGDKKYYFISLLIILETMIPFCMVFENRKPEARELVLISSLCAVAVAGRAAFFMLPQFKPVVALVIISGVCFGGETGFIVGAITGFVSNFFFGQGPWSPWQMFAFGIIGFIAGVLFTKGLLRRTKAALCIFGGIATFVIYGAIMNSASVIMWQSRPTAEMFASSFALGIPFDLIHAASTVFFLWFLSEPMIEKLERIKVKYGILNK